MGNLWDACPYKVKKGGGTLMNGRDVSRWHTGMKMSCVLIMLSGRILPVSFRLAVQFL